MGDIVRRRGMGEVDKSPYPIYGDYIELNEYGKFFFDSQSTNTTNTNTFIKSGTTSYKTCGGGARSKDFYVTLTASQIKLTSKDGSAWITKTFAGFPVKIKRCSGSETGAPTATFIVTKVE